VDRGSGACVTRGFIERHTDQARAVRRGRMLSSASVVPGGVPMTNEAQVYAYLTQPEVRFLDAAVARLIPADELGPGGKEAGVTTFIDRQLMSTWGVHGRNYRQGPWLDGTPQQGYQSRLTPQEIYRAAIPEINRHCTARYEKNFEFLTAERQDEVLHDLEAGRIELDSVSSKVFFGLLLRNTMEGFFADPMYGGNRDKAGWKLVGFPGVAASNYNDYVERHNVPYRVEPVSILDIQEQRVKLDAQGYPRHVVLNEQLPEGGNESD
jgi:gluconate 2-dehydrogenase gamma chain